MLITLSDQIRNIAADIPEGDVVKILHGEPDMKAPRRNPAVCNKSNRTDYMKNYMKEYREEGKDYQNIPESVKEWRRKRRKKKKKVAL